MCEERFGQNHRRPAEEGAGDVDTTKIRRIRQRLLRWGRTNFQYFAWRSETDPWLSLAAEIMLQRTRARQVERVFLEFRAQYPTAESLMTAGPAAAHSILSRLGLHWRGLLLYDVAVAVCEWGGVPPEHPADLRRLPGVGPYTAAAWLSLHRGVRAVIVDSNVARWLSRMTSRPYQRDPRHVHWVQDLAERLTPRHAFRDYNYAVLDFTMNVCTNRAPRCPECPLRADCDYGRRATDPGQRDELTRPERPDQTDASTIARLPSA
jgi:A/G-specific adenine glycosylase